MPGIESFGRPRPGSEEDHVVLNARSIPVLEAGIANIKLGVFSVVCRRVSPNWEDPKCGIALAHAVKCALFGERSDPIRLETVIDRPQDVLDREIEATAADDSYMRQSRLHTRQRSLFALGEQVLPGLRCGRRAAW